MFKGLKDCLLEEHTGIGGLYFVFANTACAFMLGMILQVAWMAHAVAVSDNMAQVVAINVAVHSYANNKPSFTQTNPNLVSNVSGFMYNPLNDFNQMLRTYGLSGVTTNQSSQVVVTWNAASRTASVQFSEFETTMHSLVTPHLQQSTIEIN